METGFLPVFVFSIGGGMTLRGRKQPAAGRTPARRRRKDRPAPNRQQTFVDGVTRLADPLCRAEGLELVYVEYQREPGGLTLRLYLDKPGGITLDDCVDISRQLEDMLDVHAQDMPPYRLEVSSPGTHRPVGKLADFERFKGQRVKIRLVTAVNGRKNVTGTLDGVDEQNVYLKVDDRRINFDFMDISKAHLINYNGER
jgi:ribosome maturation factor RimP